MKQIKSIGRNVKITFDISKLTQVRSELAKKYAARVGVLGQKNNRVAMETGETHEQYRLRVKKLKKDHVIPENDSQNNADIGLIHELGSLSRGIPRRSFLEMPLTLKMPEYAKKFGQELMKGIDEGNLKPAFIRLGIKGEAVVQQAFASRGFGVWKPNSPSTIARKGSSSPLIDTAQLRRSITSDVVEK